MPSNDVEPPTPSTGPSRTGGWLMTSVAPWGENREDAFDQSLVEMGLGDTRMIRVEGAMLPMGFVPQPARALGMGSLVECHLAVGETWDGGSACAGVAYALAVSPEGDECAIVSTISTKVDADETEILLRHALRRRMASRDLELREGGNSYDVAVDEVTAGPEHHGVVIAGLILPQTFDFQPVGAVGRVREITASDDDDHAPGPRRLAGTRETSEKSGVRFDL